MGFRHIRSRIALCYSILVGVGILAVGLSLAYLVGEWRADDLQRCLRSDAHLVERALALSAPGEDRGALDAEVTHLASEFGRWVAVVSDDGEVLADSHVEPAGVGSQSFRPEIVRAREEGLGISVRYGEAYGYDSLFVALSSQVDGQRVRYVRVAASLQPIHQQVRLLRRVTLGAAVASIVIACLLARLIARRTTETLDELQASFRSMARRDLDAAAPVGTYDETGAAVMVFNESLREVRDLVQRLESDRAQLSAVLDNMADGVVITDGEGHVVLVNPTAAELFTIDRDQTEGRSFPQVVRQHEIIELWRACVSSGDPQVGLIEGGARTAFLQVIVTPLPGPGETECLVMFQDLSQVRRLETIRREFVSNVSHELRTPLASLKALVDTLRDGALEDPPQARRFLDRMDGELDSLSQMATELLDLTLVESGRNSVLLAPTPVDDIVQVPVERMHAQAERKGIALELEAEFRLPLVLADASRLRQVITSLLHNAVKFTPAGGKITVQVTRQEGELLFIVHDTGVGIAEDVLPRIFERFFRGDRSRTGGGTGLGLAIAKHIVEAHGGRIWATSEEGQGSSFCFTVMQASKGDRVDLRGLD